MQSDLDFRHHGFIINSTHTLASITVLIGNLSAQLNLALVALAWVFSEVAYHRFQH